MASEPPAVQYIGKSRAIVLLLLSVAAFAFSAILVRPVIMNIIAHTKENYFSRAESLETLAKIGAFATIIVFIFALARVLSRLVRSDVKNAISTITDYLISLSPALVSLLTAVAVATASFFKGSASSVTVALVVILVAPIVLRIYFAPTFVAYKRNHINKAPIFVVNLFFGWTIFGWVGALVWALYKFPSPDVATSKS